jgi:hypothetical protein
MPEPARPGCGSSGESSAEQRSSTLPPARGALRQGNPPAFGCSTIARSNWSWSARFAPFLALLTLPYCWIVPREAVEYYGEDFFRNPVGTGPFQLAEWRADAPIGAAEEPALLQARPQGRRLPYLEHVVVRFLRDPKTALWSSSVGDWTCSPA